MALHHLVVMADYTGEPRNSAAMASAICSIVSFFLVSMSRMIRSAAILLCFSIKVARSCLCR